MKTISKFLLVLMLAVPFVGFTGCDDDDDDPVQGEAKNIEGTYKGDVKLGENVVASGMSIAVTTVNEVKSELKLDEFTVAGLGMVVPTLTVQCDVSYVNGEYRLNNGSVQTTLDLPEVGETPLTITISGTVKGSDMTLNIGGIPLVSPVYEGKKQ